ncbi:hypothetical protein BK004_03895 [bacterium CG10_46_32]|nr:MAG: hypothetical protein BK004_03895 [bacterium CG10_46_32]PIR55863.1 MAG: hypothetical protein COU73_03925 [Parcubacteria group bacterium CG10_big_fil_rev_8_21_14_0_10_46_32]
MPIHSNTAQGRWQELSFAEQMGNIGSEVSRAASADKRGDVERRNKSIERALELVDLTLQNQASLLRRRELALFRGTIEAAREGSADAGLAAAVHYCLPFGVLARKHV